MKTGACRFLIKEVIARNILQKGSIWKLKLRVVNAKSLVTSLWDSRDGMVAPQEVSPVEGSQVTRCMPLMGSLGLRLTLGPVCGFQRSWCQQPLPHDLFFVVIYCTDAGPEQAHATENCKLWNHKPKEPVFSLKIHNSGNVSLWPNAD